MDGSVEFGIGGLAVWQRGRDQVVEALDGLYRGQGCEPLEGEGPDVEGEERALVIPGSKGWTSLYLERGERDSSVATELSQRLSTVVLAHRAQLYDAFYIQVYAGGELIDEYQSCPELLASFGDPELGPAALARTEGQAELLAAAVSQVDGALLAEIYRESRLVDLDAASGAPLPVTEALSLLRKATGIGTFEHSFEDLWFAAEGMGLKVRYRAYRRALSELEGWERLERRARDARARWSSPGALIREGAEGLGGAIAGLFTRASEGEQPGSEATPPTPPGADPAAAAMAPLAQPGADPAAAAVAPPAAPEGSAAPPSSEQEAGRAPGASSAVVPGSSTGEPGAPSAGEEG